MEAARKVVGVGSVGTRAWIVLMLGNNDERSVVPAGQGSPGLGARTVPGQEQHANHGQRVVEGQRLTQSASDIFLGWIRSDGLDGVPRDYYIRQLWDGKGSAIIEAMKPSGLAAYARPLRLDAGTRPCSRPATPAEIASYLGTNDRFDQASRPLPKAMRTRTSATTPR